jgi:RNase P/RNase MRP subunit p30
MRSAPQLEFERYNLIRGLPRACRKSGALNLEPGDRMATLRILTLDDNPHDRDLTLRELRKEFPDISVISPVDDVGFREALANADFDLVITDYDRHRNPGGRGRGNEVRPR